MPTPPPPVRMAAALAMALVALGALVLALGTALSGCASSASGASDFHVETDWRLVPEGTVLGQRRQFFLYGRHLDSARVTAPPSVKVEAGAAQPGGRSMPVFLTVSALAKDSLAKGESVGVREIAVKTADTALIFKLKVVDEALPR